MNMPFAILCVVFVLVLLTMAILWAIWIAPFVRSHGRRNAFFPFNWAPLADYGTAVRISRETGYRPWFVKTYGAMLLLAHAVLLLCAVLCLYSK